MASNNEPPQHPPTSSPPDYKSPEWDAADNSVKSYQEIIDLMRKGRIEANTKIADMWNGWYNNLMSICFALGGALVALAPVVTKDQTTVNEYLFWSGILILIGNGIYILLRRKQQFEKESIAYINSGYEHEYYATKIKNYFLDYLLTGFLNEKEIKKYKKKLIDVAKADISRNQKDNNGVTYDMDAATALLVAAILCEVLATIKNSAYLGIASILALLTWLAILVWFRQSASLPVSEIAKRKEWEDKINNERDRKLF